jgi:hypothetical protein
VDRERYGRSAAPRYSEPPRQSQPQVVRRRDERPPRQSQPQPQQHRGGNAMPRSTGRDSSEPWSEVPPELEELLRAQLSTKLSRPAESAPSGSAAPAASAEQTETKAPARRGGRRKPVEAGEVAAVEAVAEATPIEAPVKAKPSPRSRRKPAEPSGEAAGTAEVTPAVEVEAAPAAPKKRAPARRKTAAAAEAAGDAPAEGSEPAGE